MAREDTLKWFSDEKGITEATVDAFGIKLDDDGAIYFPYGVGPDGEPDFYKKRVNREDGRREFTYPKGKRLQLFHKEDNHTHTFLVEGETDTMRLWQELGGADSNTGVIGLPGIESWKNEWADVFKDCEQVWVVLDNDQDYNVRARVDTAFRNIRASISSIGVKVRRVYLPEDVNDVCEFFNQYNLDALRLLAARNPIGKSRFKVLDLTKEPPPVRWLVDAMICRGDVHLLIGEPGIGKSWLTMLLALSIADNKETYLGKSINEHGRVLYFDEENPEDLIYDRFRKLGIDLGAAKNIRYLNNLGIRLDKQDADLVIEEALDYEPSLIVLDSLTRFHTEDENHAGAMAGLFHSAIKPLARETGAAVVLIHHASKTDSNSSYKRSRGSGDITASVDAGYDVREIGENSLAIANFKSRRHAQGDTLYVSLRDTEDGHVKLLGGETQEVPF